MARRFDGPLVVALAALALFAPGEAAAQIQPQSWGSDYCADRSPNGQFTVPNNGISQLNISFFPGSAPGSVQAEMYNTLANECLLTRPAVCPESSCALQVQTVCEFHCGHNHTAPYGWTVQLWPTTNAGNFVGWPGTSCLPIKDAPQSYCIVKMPTTGALSAQPRFAAAPDATPPTAPSASVSGVGSYAMTVSWSPANDDYWLGGYDIFNGGTRLTRVSAGSTNTRLESLSCATTYSIRVVAFDSRNSTSSNTVSARTGACVGSSDTRRPNTVFHVKPPRVTRSRTASFHFGANERARFRCKLDRRAWAKCRRSDPYRLAMGKTYRRLRPGYHTFRVRAIDRAGNRERSPAVYRWRIRR
jgi:Fibronectin type III domain